MVTIPTRTDHTEHTRRGYSDAESETTFPSQTAPPTFRAGKARLDTSRIFNLITFGEAVREAAESITADSMRGTGGLSMASLAETIQSLSIDGIRPPDPIHSTLAILALRQIGESGGALVIPGDWTNVLHRIAANAGDSAVRQVGSTLAFMEARYPGVLVWRSTEG